MPRFQILYDEPHEASWFRQVNPMLADAEEHSITSAQSWPSVARVLAYDRPDIILLDAGKPILVVEETVEVPSGHNVGQRFARIAAAAEAGVPCMYFGPYVARKHGGATEGPRYMNLRLFHAIDVMIGSTGTAITTINWPVDSRCEVMRGHAKDADVRDYMDTFLSEYLTSDSLNDLNRGILASRVHRRMLADRAAFIENSVRNADQYDGPPPSVEILSSAALRRRFQNAQLPSATSEAVLYNVGMTGIRSDPYTGMAILYRYLYVIGNASRALVLWFPNISYSMWQGAARNGRRKDVRLYRVAADAICFCDRFVLRGQI